MPRFDGTGPEGRGPMTGRGAGNCTSTADSSDDRRIYYGFGRGKGLRYCRLQTVIDEKQNLRDIKKQLEVELKAVSDRLDGVSK